MTPNTYIQCTYIHTYMYTYKCTYIHPYIHPYIHTYIHPYIHIYMYAYICTYMHPYIHTYVAVMGRITLCVFQSCYHVQSVVAQNIHKQWSHTHLCRPVRYSCIYAVLMSPAINRSSAPQRSEHSNTKFCTTVLRT